MLASGLLVTVTVFSDTAYLRAPNDPANHLFRSRGTAFHLNELDLDMAGASVRKTPSRSSRWGLELTVHGGKDDEVFGVSATAPNIGGYRWLRHLGPTNVSYLAPVGKGLRLQGGIFGSLIGYDSLYAKDNFSYTRPWGADFTPYLMMGVSASYPFSDKLTGSLAVVNGYWHLAHANDVPSGVGQIAYRLAGPWTLKETVLWGPHQSNTALELCRFLSDTIVERKSGRLTVALDFTASSEKVDLPGRPRAWWISAQLPVHLALHGRWSATIRPEIAWDSDGRWTTFEQTVKALTTTLEYRTPYRQTATIVRLEHRYDDSRGPGGGFFKGGRLTPTQHLFIAAVLFTLDR
jgi:hypothetical protein